MQQIVVPQFIDVEDKIIGPLTIRQFIIIMLVGFVLFLEFKLAAFGWFILEAVITVGIGIMFAFVKFNGMPFHYFLFNLIQTFKKPKLRVWQKVISTDDLQESIHTSIPMVTAASGPTKPLLQQSRLQQLTLLVDTGGAYKPEEEDEFSKGKSEEQ